MFGNFRIGCSIRTGFTVRSAPDFALTGFDAETVSTLYLDKPMKDHTLMQTIARANRVSDYLIDEKAKKNGEIIDYYNVFRNMKKALADYALGSDEDEEPVQEKGVLFTYLDQALTEGIVFCKRHTIDMESILQEDEDEVFKKVEKFKQYTDILIAKDHDRKEFYVIENTISSLYEACKPEILEKEKRPLVYVFQYLRKMIDAEVGLADVEEVKRKIAELLDESIITTEDYTLSKDPDTEYKIIQKGKILDFSEIDYDKLKNDFQAAAYKNIEIANIRAFLEKKLEQMLTENSTRGMFAQKLQDIIDRYNSGTSSVDNYFEELMAFTKELESEDERHIKEGLTKDELELYDIIKKDKMTKAEEQKVKLAAQSLLHRLIEEHPKVLVQDWYKDGQTKAKVKVAIEEVLDHNLPDSFDTKVFKMICNKVYDLVYDYAVKGFKWAG